MEFSFEFSDFKYSESDIELAINTVVMCTPNAIGIFKIFIRNSWWWN